MTDAERVAAGRFWLMLQEPRRVPERKGPWSAQEVKRVLREFINARPAAYITVLTVSDDGVPEVQHGPELLTILDMRSASTARKHNESVGAAHCRAILEQEKCTKN